MLDKRGAKIASTLGCAIAAVGFYLWAQQMPDLDYSAGWWRIAVAGVGTGLILGPISTDALNRVPGTSYGEATGITQTARNLGASLGLAVLGAILISQTKTNVVDKLTSLTGSDAVPRPVAEQVAEQISSASSGGGGGGSATTAQLHAVQEAFALSTQTVFYVMAGAMALAFVATQFLPAGKAPEAEVLDTAEAPQERDHEPVSAAN